MTGVQTCALPIFWLCDPQKMSVVVFCNLVGAIRHGLLTPYGDETLFGDVVDFIVAGLRND